MINELRTFTVFTLFLITLSVVGCGSSKKDNAVSKKRSEEVMPAPPENKVDCLDYLLSLFYRGKMAQMDKPSPESVIESKHVYRSGQLAQLLLMGERFFGPDHEFTPELQERFLKIYDAIVDGNGDIRETVVHPDDQKCKDHE